MVLRTSNITMVLSSCHSELRFSGVENVKSTPVVEILRSAQNDSEPGVEILRSAQNDSETGVEILRFAQNDIETGVEILRSAQNDSETGVEILRFAQNDRERFAQSLETRKESYIYRGRTSNRGFTLLEILATFVLIVIIIPVAMKGLGMIMRLTDQSVQKVEACSLAEGKLTELVVTQDYLNSSMNGDFGEEWPKYRWEAQVVDWSGVSVKEITVFVYWQEKMLEEAVTLSTLVYPE